MTNTIREPIDYDDEANYFPLANPCNHVTEIESLQQTASTQPFTDWFSNSRVTTEDNQPLLVFHGTNRNFQVFDPKRHRTILNQNYQGDGFHFTSSAQVATKYADSNRNQTLDK